MITIRNTHGDVMHEVEAATLREAVEQLVRDGANLYSANLSGANLSGADLRDAYLRSANLRGANLSGANLRGANLCGANLCSADLYSADLRDADLYSANLRGADLCGANLRGANLRGADLRDADLRDAYLRGASLRSADLYSANLRGADLCGANLRGADLRDADLRDADLRDAYLRGSTGINKPVCTPLMMLYDQPGEIVACKLVNGNGDSPISGTVIRYIEGAEVSVDDADTDDTVECGAGINVATLDWCMAHWKPGYRILRVTFTAADIAAIPMATDGKFRLHRCRVGGEVDLREIGLVTEEEEVTR